MANFVNDETMSGNESVGSVNSPSPPIPQPTATQVPPPPPPAETQHSLVGVTSPLRARSVSPTPRYTPYGVPSASTQHAGVVLGETRGKPSETIQSRIEELSRQVADVTDPLTENVKRAAEEVTQARFTAAAAMEKASAVEMGTVQMRSEIAKTIQDQLRAVEGVTDTKIATLVSELSSRLSGMVTQSREEPIQRQSVELGDLRREL